MITTEQIKQLRDETGVSVMVCKKALEEAGGDFAKARILLKKAGTASAAKKADRQLGAGIVGAYIHASGTVGAMVFLACETDFVARNDEFKALAYDIAMHITALNPVYVSRDEVDESEHNAARGVFEQEVEKSGKSKADNGDLAEKIIQGKMDSYFRDKILLEQAFIKDDKKSIKSLLDDATMKFGERVAITKFARVSQ
jgi:elongation factor Ts